MALEEEEPDDDVAKISRLAAKRGFWSERSAKDMAAQARLHHVSPRTFLKKMLEIKGGLTHDEIARLEKEALAPPAPAAPGKALPKPFEGSETPAGAPEIVSHEHGKALPRPFDQAPATTSEPAPLGQIQPMATPSRALPRLGAKPASVGAPALGATAPGEGTVLKKKLPSLGAKRPSATADALPPAESPEPREPEPREPKSDELKSDPPKSAEPKPE